MDSAETPSRQQVPVWVVITFAVIVAASGPAFFHEGPFIGLSACVLVAYMHLQRQNLSFGSRLMRVLGLGGFYWYIELSGVARALVCCRICKRIL